MKKTLMTGILAILSVSAFAGDISLSGQQRTSGDLQAVCKYRTTNYVKHALKISKEKTLKVFAQIAGNNQAHIEFGYENISGNIMTARDSKTGEAFITSLRLSLYENTVQNVDDMKKWGSNTAETFHSGAYSIDKKEASVNLSNGIISEGGSIDVSCTVVE